MGERLTPRLSEVLLCILAFRFLVGFLKQVITEKGDLFVCLFVLPGNFSYCLKHEFYISTRRLFLLVPLTLTYN